MNRVRLPLLSMYLICLAFSPAAQEIPRHDKNPGLEIGSNYVNTNVYMGRTYKKDAAIMAPDLIYTFNNGIFLTGSLDFIPSHKIHTVDNGSLELGYNYHLTDYLEGSISFTKMFYAQHSTLITSSVSSEFNAGIDFNNDLISPGLNIVYALGISGIRNDLTLIPNLSHEFVIDMIFGNQDRLTVSPTVEMNAGTQHFYSSYFNVTRTIVRKNFRTGKERLVSTSELDKFSLLDYEVSVPVTYLLKPFLLSFSPVLALPQNKLPSQITQSQQNKPYLFYFNLGLNFKF